MQLSVRENTLSLGSRSAHYFYLVPPSLLSHIHIVTAVVCALAASLLISSEPSRMFRTGAQDKGEVFASFTRQANGSTLSAVSIPSFCFHLKDTHIHTYTHYLLIVTHTVFLMYFTI